MPAGFFDLSDVARPAPAAFGIPRCGACGLLKQCHTPKMPESGRGRRGVLIIGEAPGKDEDAAGKPFIGRAGEKLAAALASFGVDLRRDCWITNALSCRPPGNKIDDEKKIDYCRPLVQEKIRRLKPHTIILLGYRAVKSVIKPAYPDDNGTMEQWAGWRIPMHEPNAWVCPTWHPAYLMRQNDPALEFWWRKHLQRAFRRKMPPWGKSGPPAYAKKIEIITDPDAAAQRIRGMMALGDFPATFDFETDRLKPDDPRSEIVCCAISWEGRTTIAYPWAGAAIRATRDFLRSPAPKRGFNTKFETRWAKAKLGVTPKNWEWCGMLAAHVCDGRGGITSAKFQAFVRLGVPLYNRNVKAYLDASGGNERNKIRQLDLMTLLRYVGMDAVLEWWISEDQRKELGICNTSN